MVSKVSKRRVWMGPVVLVLVTACGGGGEAEPARAVGGSPAASRAELAQGQKLYQQTCAMCHGYQGEGVQRLGKPIVGSDFVRRMSDEELLAFLIEGRTADHPDNTQGIPMPPRGGNPSLTDKDLSLIVAYMRLIA